MLRALPLVLAGSLFTSVLAAQEAKPRRPDRFAIVFNMGYAGDHLPTDRKAFERLVIGVKQAQFNVVLGEWTDWRAKLCKKHGVQLFVDLLAAEHHVYKEVAAAKKLCGSLAGNDVVYGYHLWSDNIGSTYPGRSREAKNVRSWDATHPVYVGCYRMSRISRVQGDDLFGYYDFHWKRGGHWSYLSKALRVAKSKGTHFLRYLDSKPGKVGKGNRNRVAYTIATSIPFGLKGYTFHYTGGVVDRKTGKLDALGQDLRAVNAAFAAIGAEVMRLGNPRVVYSTPVSKSAKDRPVEPVAVPAGLVAVPEQHWFGVTKGELLVGEFADPSGHAVLALASHNAYQPQMAELRITPPNAKVSRFDRKTGKWRAVRTKNGGFTVQVAHSATELVRVETSRREKR